MTSGELPEELRDPESARRLLVDELDLIDQTVWQNACEGTAGIQPVVAVLARVLDAPASHTVTRVRTALTRYQFDEILAGRARGLVWGPRIILDRLGKGGTAEVFAALHRQLRRVEALKIELVSGSAERRGHWEAVLAAGLKHPNLPVVYDAGMNQGRAYLAMELVPGEDLERYRRRLAERGERVQVSDAVRWMWEVARCLNFLHQKGIVHRDVKLSNIMVALDGGVRLLDFGTASGSPQGEREDPDLLPSGGRFATTEESGANTSEDFFGLGCGIYHLLTGRWPFNEVREAERARAGGAPKPLSLRTVRIDVPLFVDAVVGRMIDRIPARRYLAAIDLQRDLSYAIRSMGAEASPVGVPRLTSRRGIVRRVEKAIFERLVARSTIRLGSPSEIPPLSIARGVRPEEVDKVVAIALDASPHHSMRAHLQGNRPANHVAGHVSVQRGGPLIADRKLQPSESGVDWR